MNVVDCAAGPERRSTYTWAAHLKRTRNARHDRPRARRRGLMRSLRLSACVPESGACRSESLT